MLQAQCVAHFVRGQLPDAGQRQLQHGVILRWITVGVCAVVGGQQAFEDQVVLADTQRAQRHMALMISPVRGSTIVRP